MEPVNYAIVLYMNDEKTAMVKEWIRELAPVCGSDYCLETEPHITISAIIAEDEELIKKEAEKLSGILKRGELKDTEWKREYIDHEGMNTVLNNDKFR